MNMFDLSFSKKNFTWGGAAVLFVFLFQGLLVSIFAAGLLLFSSAFYWFSKKLNNNLCLTGLIAALFFLTSLVFHGPYLTTCIFILLFALILSFNALRMLIKDQVVALWIILVVLLGMSFVPSSLQVYATIGWLACMSMISIFKFENSKTNIKLFLDYVKFSLSWFDVLTCFLLLLPAVLLAVCKNGYFWAIDLHHPIYELSIGQSYKQALFNVPDLSYVGKIIRFHFLSTQLPFYFSRILDVSLLDSLYTISMTFFMLFSFLLIPSFFNCHPKLKTPLFFIFFMPSFIFITDCVYRATLAATISYFVAFIFIVCALHFLIQQRYWMLFTCSVLLLLIKASFFMSLCGGIFIFWLRQRYSLTKFIMRSVPFVAFFFLINYLFLSGAHAHNLWALMPSFMFHYTRESYFFCRAEAILGMIILVGAVYVLIKEKSAEIQSVAAVIISGLIGWLFIVELSEANSYQFVRAIYFPLSILLWGLINQKFDSISFAQYANNTKDCLFKAFFTCLTLLSFSFSACFLFQPFSLAIDVVRGGKFSYTQQLIKSYSWLNKNVSPNSIVLFGLHYDSSEEFIRSALSGEQMVCEGFKAKGILMEKDYVPRKADIIRFYKYFVNSSDLSKKCLNSFELAECGDTPGIPLSQSPAFSVRMLHYLSLGKEWHFVNRSKQVKFELKQVLKEDFTEQDALNFIKRTRITHIVLENGDTLSNFLKEISREVYADGESSIFEIFTK